MYYAWPDPEITSARLLVFRDDRGQEEEEASANLKGATASAQKGNFLHFDSAQRNYGEKRRLRQQQQQQKECPSRFLSLMNLFNTDSDS
jgi:hypothetical protein